MTIPFQNIPDTRPGYAFQNPGVGGTINQSIAQILQAILMGTEARQRQQQLDQNQQYQQGLLSNEQARQAMEQRRALQQLLSQREVGTAMQAMGQGLPTGIAGSTGPLTLESALQLVSPENAPTLATQAAPVVKRQEDAAKRLREEQEKNAAIRRQELARQALLRALPPSLRPIAEMRWLAKESGMGEKEIEDVAIREYTLGMSPKDIDLLDKRLPEDARGLPLEKKIGLFVRDLEARIDARYRPRQGEGPPTIAERKAAGWYKRSHQANERFTRLAAPVKTPQWFAQELARSTVLGIGNKLTTPEARQWWQNTLQFAQGILRYDTGAQINRDEIMWILSTYIPMAGDDDGTLAQKAEARLTALDELQLSAGRAFQQPSRSSGAPPPPSGVPRGPGSGYDYDALQREFENRPKP